jgi:hypothetical protein
VDAHAKLLADLRALGSNGLSLPSETVGLVLSEAKRHGVPWVEAWNVAVNNAAPHSHVPSIDSARAEAIAEDRALLDECEPAFRAAYESSARPLERDARIAALAEQRLVDLDVPSRDEFPSLRAIAPPPVNGNGARMRDAA